MQNFFLILILPFKFLFHSARCRSGRFNLEELYTIRTMGRFCCLHYITPSITAPSTRRIKGVSGKKKAKFYFAKSTWISFKLPKKGERPFDCSSLVAC